MLLNWEHQSLKIILQRGIISLSGEILGTGFIVLAAGEQQQIKLLCEELHIKELGIFKTHGIIFDSVNFSFRRINFLVN